MATAGALLALQNYGSDGGGSPAGLIIPLVIAAVEVAAFWMIFQKAGQPGWAALIPIYNAWILLKAVNRPGWWLILFLIPFVNFIAYIIVMIDLAKVFGKGGGFAVGLIFLPFIFAPILGFGGAQYAPRAA